MACFLSSSPFILAGSPSEGIKINQEREAWIPSPRNDYQILHRENDLYVIWGSPEKQRIRLFLSRIDLADFEVRSSVQFPLPEMDGDQVAPGAAWHEERLELVWIVGSGRGRNRVFFVHFGSWAPDDEEVHLETVERYGTFLSVPRIVSTTHGVYVVGVSQEKGDRARRLRLYKKSESGWKPIDAFQDPGTANSDPQLLEHQGRLFLFWVQNGCLVYSVSADGESWSDIEVLTEGWTASPVARSLEDRLEVSWLEVGPSSSVVRWKASLDGGESWGEAEGALEFPAVRGALRFLPPEKETLILLSYWDSGEQVDVLRALARDKEGWHDSHINAFFKGAGRAPFWDGVLRDDRLTIFWHQSLRRGNGIYRNDAVAPWDDWLEKPERVDPDDPKLRRSAPKLIAWDDQLFYIYYQYEAGFSMAARANNRGDLVLEKLREKE